MLTYDIYDSNGSVLNYCVFSRNLREIPQKIFYSGSSDLIWSGFVVVQCWCSLIMV